jgi:hypothetical protein
MPELWLSAMYTLCHFCALVRLHFAVLMWSCRTDMHATDNMVHVCALAGGFTDININVGK